MRKISSTNKREDAESVLIITFAHFFKAIQQRIPAHEQIKALVLLPNSSLGGEFRQNSAERWTGKIDVWANEAMGFCQTHYGNVSADALQEKTKAVNQQLNPLRFEAVNMMAWVDAIIKGTETDDENQAIANPEDEDDEATNAEINAAVSALLKKITLLLPEQDGVFANDLGDILRLSPKLRIPTAALLYAIANNEIYNSWEEEIKNNTKQHGNTSKKSADTKANQDNANQKGEDEQTQLQQEWVVIEESSEQEANNSCFDPTAEYAPDAIDNLPDDSDAKEREQWEYLQHVEKLLRIPLDKAEQEAESAYGTKNQQSAEEKLVKQQMRFSENMGVLKLTKDGYTEDEIGKKLRLTRDKVRYRKRDIQSLLASLQTTD